ncbi:MAG: hypothetical protein IPL46_30735 [Saprospiraceae bacterium]|nr:hypothetical protein [Saprospiraceae bacterium]
MFEQFLQFKNLKQETLEILLHAYESLLIKLEYEASVDPFPVDFRSIFVFLLKLLYKRSTKSIAALGLKEILCHEYISYLINHRVKVVLIIRDPRSVIESLNFGVGDQFTGGIRPTLLNLHNWREVAEIGLQHRKNDNLLLIKYEDFLSDIAIRKKLTDFLQLKYTSIDIKALKDMDGNNWRANSSFVNRNRDKLDTATTQYIESICFFEMRALGYQTDIAAGTIPEIVKIFEEPWTISPRDYYLHDYTTNQEHVDQEIERWSRKMKTYSE